MPDADTLAAVRALLRAQPLAALGTLHGGRPFVSMVPVAPLDDGSGLVIHVSALASHTHDLHRDPRVSLMLMAAPGEPPQATARLTLQGEALPCPADDPLHGEARRVYLARFPDSEPMFGFGDFALFVIRPDAARWVGGFGRAVSLRAEVLAEVLRRA